MLLEMWKDDKKLFYLSIISLEVTALLFLRMHFFYKELDCDKSLELILTVNGLFSAILVTYFFNRISRTLDFKKDDAEEAIIYSQKITDFRRICKILTDYYGIWTNENATKRLLEGTKFKHIDYFDYKLSSFSDYEPVDAQLIEELHNHPNYSESSSDLFLGLISLVENRKVSFYTYDSSLYKDFQRKEIYNYQFIANCVEIDYAGRLAFWFRENGNYIRYENFRSENREDILNAMQRIDKKYIGVELNNSTLAVLCDDMNEFYFKELLKCLENLKEGLSPFNKLIFTILISSLCIGIILPMAFIFALNNSTFKTLTTEIIISLNFFLLFFFVVSLYRIIEKEITWS
jgi:hypothetical protein